MAQWWEQCVPGWIPGPGVTCGLSLLLVLFSALKGLPLGTAVFSSQKLTFSNSSSTQECTAISERVLVNSMVLDKQIKFHFYSFLNYTTPHDQLEKNAPFFFISSNSSKVSQNQSWLAPKRFPALAWTKVICLNFWLVHSIVCVLCD